MTHSNPTSNFALPAILNWITAIETLILLAAAVVLFCFPLWQDLRWPWAIKPYNAVFLGGIYWAACAVVGIQFLIRRWSPARLIQPLVLIFSTILLVVSLAYPEQFDWQRRLVKAWFLVYTVVPLSAAASVWAYRDRPPAQVCQLPHRLAALMQGKALVLGLYGIALLVIPAIATAFWPWPIDVFHGRLYSAMFLAMAWGNARLSRSTTALELLTLGIAEVLLGMLPLLGIAHLDRVLGEAAKINWSLLGSWLWFALLGCWAMTGASLIHRALRSV